MYNEKSIKYVKSFLLYWQFFYVWLFMNCSESALHIKKQPEVSNTTKKKQKMGHGTNAVKIQNGQ